MEKSILFNTDMVQAILEDRKTCTRRIIKDVEGMNFIGFVSCSTPKEHEGCAAFGEGNFKNIVNAKIKVYKKPPYRIGDVLYVRETWSGIKGGNLKKYVYKATDKYPFGYKYIVKFKWKPSIHMPKEAARIFLKVTDVRVEKLQDITEKQARAEGVDGRCLGASNGCSGTLSTNVCDFSVEAFQTLWDSTVNKKELDKYSWNANPYVWVIKFERIKNFIPNLNK